VHKICMIVGQTVSKIAKSDRTHTRPPKHGLKNRRKQRNQYGSFFRFTETGRLQFKKFKICEVLKNRKQEKMRDKPSKKGETKRFIIFHSIFKFWIKNHSVNRFLSIKFEF
jgi:hypothetical protein